MKFTVLLSAVVLYGSTVLASQPPACLLQAVNTQQNPANLSAVCGSQAAHSVQVALASLCSSNFAVAQSAFIATCSGAGTAVAAYTPTSTASSGTARPTGTASVSGGSGTASATGARATGMAASGPEIMGGSFIAAIVAIAGAVAAL